MLEVFGERCPAPEWEKEMIRMRRESFEPVVELQRYRMVTFEEGTEVTHLEPMPRSKMLEMREMARRYNSRNQFGVAGIYFVPVDKPV